MTNVVKLLQKISSELPENSIFGVNAESIETEAELIAAIDNFCRTASEKEIISHIALLRNLMKHWWYYARIEEYIWAIQYTANDYRAYQVQLRLTERY